MKHGHWQSSRICTCTVFLPLRSTLSLSRLMGSGFRGTGWFWKWRYLYFGTRLDNWKKFHKLHIHAVCCTSILFIPLDHNWAYFDPTFSGSGPLAERYPGCQCSTGLWYITVSQDICPPMAHWGIYIPNMHVYTPPEQARRPDRPCGVVG